MVRSAEFQKLVKSEPTLLMFNGEFRHNTMREQRVSEGEVRAAIRSAGLASARDAEAVVLETDGSFSVVKRSIEGASDALEDVEGYSSKPRSSG